MRWLILLSVSLVATIAPAAEVPWGGLAARADAVLYAPDLRGWMARFDAAFRATLANPAVAGRLAPSRAAFAARVGFDPFAAPPATLASGLGAFSFREGQPHEVLIPGGPPVADAAGPAPDLSRCVDLAQAQLVLVAGLPGSTLDRGVAGCTTLRIAEVDARPILWLDQSSALAGIGLLAPLFPRDEDDAAFRAVGADARGIVRVRTAPAARGMMRPLIAKGGLPAPLQRLLEAHFGDEIVIAAGDPPRLLVRIREPAAAQAALDALGPDWGGLRGATPVWGGATPGAKEAPKPGFATIHGEYLVLGHDAALMKPPQGDYRDRLDPGLRARAAAALAFVDLDVAGLDLVGLLGAIPAGAAPGLDPEVVQALLRDVSRLGVAVGLSDGRFWLRFRAEAARSGAAGSAAAGSAATPDRRLDPPAAPAPRGAAPR